MSEESISLEEKIAKGISKKIGNKLSLAELEMAKMEYGLSILLIDTFKLILVFIIALLLHLGIEVLVTTLSFIMIRKVTKSYHASNSTVCTILSLFFLVFLPFLVTFFELTMTRSIFCITVLILCIILGVKGGAITQERGSILDNGRARITGMSLFLSLLGLIQPSDSTRMLIFLGMTIATLLMFISKKEGMVENDQKIKNTKI